MNQVFIDIETGGLDYREHALTQIAAVVFDEKFETVAVWGTKVRPNRDLLVTDKAATMQGYTDAIALRQTQSFDRDEKDAMLCLRRFLADWLAPEDKEIGLVRIFRKYGHRIWAHNASFDSAFLMEAYYRANPDEDKVPFGCSCSLLHANRILPEAETPGGSLLKLAGFFGIKFPVQHNAVADSRVGIAVLKALAEYQKAEESNGS